MNITGRSNSSTAAAGGPVCPACGAAEARFCFAKNGHDLFQCRSCSALYVFPVPSREELAEFYRRTEGEQKSSLCWTGSRRHSWKTWRWALEGIERRAGRGPLLDVGCGAGQFLDFARRRGWTKLSGVELSLQAASRAREVPGAAIYMGDLLELALPSESFAGITMWDVIEHLPDPRAMIREARRLLRPGGVLVISVPNRHGLAMRIFRRHSIVVSPPEHLTYFSRAAIRKLLESEGFAIEAIRCIDIYLREWTRLFAKSPEGEAAETTLYRSFYDRLTGSRLFLAAMDVANRLLNLTRLGDQLLVLSRKENGAP